MVDEASPWYAGGLRFECTRCGRCCTGAPGFVWVTQADLAQIADFLGRPLEETRQIYAYQTPRGLSLREQANGDCVFYDSEAGCTIYPVRPPQCRTWPFWESNVASPEAWEKTRKVCPGAGQGDLISADEIIRRIRIIRL